MLFRVILADLFGEKVVANSIGLLYFTIGIVCIIAAPLGGNIAVPTMDL